MSRRRNFASFAAERQRAAERAIRARTAAIREAERFQRQQERARLADEKERQRLFHASQEEEAESRNENLAETVSRLESVLRDTLASNRQFTLDNLKSTFEPPPFSPGKLGEAEKPPRPDAYLPGPLGFFARLVPGAKARHERTIREARTRFDADTMAHANVSRTAAPRYKWRALNTNEGALDYRRKLPDKMRRSTHYGRTTKPGAKMQCGNTARRS